MAEQKDGRSVGANGSTELCDHEPWMPSYREKENVLLHQAGFLLRAA